MYIYMQRLTFLLAFILSLANCQTNDMVVYAPHTPNGTYTWTKISQ